MMAKRKPFPARNHSESSMENSDSQTPCCRGGMPGGVEQQQEKADEEHHEHRHEEKGIEAVSKESSGCCRFDPAPQGASADRRCCFW